MSLPRSTFYDTPTIKTDDAEIVARITAICEEFECYGYRRVGAELRHQGIVVNAKKIRRIMREHDLQPKRRRRFVATTDSDHASLSRLPWLPLPPLAHRGDPHYIWIRENHGYELFPALL